MKLIITIAILGAVLGPIDAATQVRSAPDFRRTIPELVGEEPDLRIAPGDAKVRPKLSSPNRNKLFVSKSIKLSIQFMSLQNVSIQTLFCFRTNTATLTVVSAKNEVPCHFGRIMIILDMDHQCHTMIILRLGPSSHTMIIITDRWPKRVSLTQNDDEMRSRWCDGKMKMKITRTFHLHLSTLSMIWIILHFQWKSCNIQYVLPNGQQKWLYYAICKIVPVAFVE